MSCIFTYTNPITGEILTADSEKELIEMMNNKARTFEQLPESLINGLKGIEFDELKQSIENIQGLFKDIKNKLVNETKVKNNDPNIIAAFNYLKNLNLVELSNEFVAAKTLLSMLKEYNIIFKTLENNMLDIINNKDLSSEEKWQYISNSYQFSNAMVTVIDSINTFLTKNISADNDFSGLIGNSLSYFNSIKVKHDNFAVDYLTDWLWESFGDTVKSKSLFKEREQILEKAITKAEKENRLQNAEHYRKQLAKLKDKALTKESLKEYMLGLKGDSNLYSYWLEASIANADPIISSFSKKLMEKITTVRLKFINSILNPLAKEYEKFSKSHNRSKNNLKEFNKGLYEWVEVYEINREDPNNIKLEKNKYLQLNKWQDISYLNDQTKMLFDIELQKNKMKDLQKRMREARKYGDLDMEANLDVEYLDSLKVLKGLQKKLRTWQQTYLEQEYTKEYYEIMDSLSDAAKAALEEIDNDILLKEDELNRRYSDELALGLSKAYINKRRLFSEYDEHGVKKEGTALEIAKELQEYKTRKAVLYKEPNEEEIRLAKERYEKHKEAFENDLKNKMKVEKWTEAMADFVRKNWIARNSYYRIKPEFYEKRKKIIDRLNELRDTVKEDSELRQKLSKLTFFNKDKDGTILGELFSDNEVKDIKYIEEELESLKLKSEHKGITKAERVRQNEILKTNTKNLSIDLFIKDLYVQKRNEEADFLRAIGLKRVNFELSMTPKEKAIQEELSILFKELSELQMTITTDNYTVEYSKQYNLFKEVKLEVFRITGELDYFNRLTSVEQEKILFAEFSKSQWYVDNHFDKLVWNPETQEYTYEKHPIAIWRKVIPVDDSYIEKESPSFRYYENSIKDIYKNPNYKKDVFTGKPVLKENTIYDKRSNNFVEDATSRKIKNYPKDQATINALEYLTNQYSQLQESIPLRNRLGWNVPYFEKDKLELISEGKSGKLIENFKRKFRTTETDIDLGLGFDTSNDFNNVFQFIPVKYKNKIEEDLVSYDIWGAIAKFGHHSMLRDQFTEMLPKAKSLLELVKSSKDFPNIETEDKNFKKIIGYFTNIGNKKNVRADNLEEIIKTVMFGELEKVSKGSINWNKVTNNMNFVASLNTLAWNIPGATVNFLSGKMQKIIEAAGGKDLNFNDYKNGQKLYYTHVNGFMKDFINLKEGDKSDIGQMVDYWGVLQGEFEESIGSNFKETQLKTVFNSFGYSMYIRKAGEHELQISLWMSLMSKTIVSYDGKIMSLFDAYKLLKSNKNSLSIEDHEGLIKKVSLVDNKYVTTDNWTYKDEIDLMLKIQKINIDLNGNYAKLNKAVAEKYALGKAIFFFRKYLVPFAMRRFGTRRLDILKDEESEGYYSTSYRAMLKPIFTNPYRFFKEKEWDWENLTEYEKANLRKFFTESALIVLFMLLISTIGDEPDELKDHNFLTLHFLFLLKKVRSETEQLNPLFGLREINAIVRSPSVAYSQTVARFSDIFAYTYYHIGDPDKAYYQKDTGGFWEKGDSKALAASLKLIGFNGKTFYPKELIEGFEYGQRAR